MPIRRKQAHGADSARSHKELTALAREVSEDLAAGNPRTSTLEAVSALSGGPSALFDLIELLAIEANRKRPREDLLEGLLFIYSSQLAELGYRNDGDPSKERPLAELRAKLLGMVRSQTVPTEVLLMMLHCFHDARLDVGPELSEALETLMQARRDADAGEETEAAEAFAEVLEQYAGDTFGLAEFIATGLSVMPAEVAAKMVQVTVLAEESDLRMASLSILHSDKPHLRDALLDNLQQAASSGLIDGVMLRRMIVVRNWLPEERRRQLDDAIKTCRKNGVACAGWPKVAAPVEMWSSGVDGSGACSLFLVVKENRKYALVSFLLKQSRGVREAFVMRQMTLKEVRATLAGARSQMLLLPSDMDHLGMSVRHFLAENVRSGEMPPFALLDVVETIGLTDLNPVRKPVRELVDELCAAIGETIPDAIIAAALDHSEEWPDVEPITEGWFMEGEEIEKLVRVRGTKNGRIEALLAGPIEAQRDWWAELVAWMALCLRQEDQIEEWEDSDQRPWLSFAIVAREILNGRPLAEIPAMRQIAERSLIFAAA
jgi:hypothetical protein